VHTGHRDHGHSQIFLIAAVCVVCALQLLFITYNTFKLWVLPEYNRNDPQATCCVRAALGICRRQ